MKHDLIGLVISYIFVFSIIGLAEWLLKKRLFSEETTRKLIHIGVSNWWIIAMFLIKSYYYAIVPPLSFVFFNYISHKKMIFKSMERPTEKKNFGTIYFPISLSLLVLLSWWDGLLRLNPYYGAVGALIMGYGDGLAATIGKKYGKRIYFIGKNKKSLEGSFTMFVVSFLIVFGISIYLIGFTFSSFFVAMAIALIATLLEAFTPFGLDNLTVPLLSFGIFVLFTKYIL